MSLIQGNLAKSAAGDFYSHPIEQSLRFNDDDSAYLNWTPASPGNRKTWTWSGWVKRGNLGSQQILFGNGNHNSGQTEDTLFFDPNNYLRFLNITQGVSVNWDLHTSQVFRDTSSWYHVVFAVDTTQATASNRLKLYVNGEQVTSFQTATYPSQNADAQTNGTVVHTIGSTPVLNAQYLDSYLAEVHFIDGTALDASYFGEFKSGVWIPKAYAGSYGTNGFYLPFNHDYSVEGFSANTYTGNFSDYQYIGGVGFSPDLVWIKNRNGGNAHAIFDSVRGTNVLLRSDQTAAEASTGTLPSLENDGFVVSYNGATQTDTNWTGSTYVAWCWDAGSGSPVSNTDGSITSTVKASTDYGFSIVSYTGTGANATVGHGLSSTPEFIIVKRRDAADNWIVQRQPNYHMTLQTTNAEGASSTFVTAWDSSTFSVGTDTAVNASSGSMIAYCFHSVSGYSKIGSYTGTGASGNSITTGFKPAFLLVKRTDVSGESWAIMDNVRDVSNPRSIISFAEASYTEQDLAINNVDFDATGFTVDSTDARWNSSGGNYIYMAFADKREAAFWLDQSGNNNDFENNNLTESDISLDSPTNNFAVLQAEGLAHSTQWANVNLSEGNLKYVKPSGHAVTARSSFSMKSGKWYCEYTSQTSAAYQQVGIVDTTWRGGYNAPYGRDSMKWENSGTPRSYIQSGAKHVENNTTYSYGASWTTGDIIGLAFDADAGNITFYKNGVSQGVAFSGLTPPTSHGWYFAFYPDNIGADTFVVNFGQDSSFAGNKTAQGNTDANGYGDFYYAPPTGYLALCTANLTVPDAMNPALDASPQDYFNTVLYTGNGTTNSYTGVGFQPDFLWIKNRTTSSYHMLNDIVRGDVALHSDQTLAEQDTYMDIVRTSDGITFNGSTTWGNKASDSYVAWNWKANGSGVSNTDGSITSTVSANTDAGFSIVSYTGNQTAGATVGHGLSTAPSVVIIKNRDRAGYGWLTGHSGIGFTKYLVMNTTNAAATQTSIWNDTAPSSSVFTLGSDTFGNYNGDNLIAYVFSEVEGFSKFGSYTGNGSTDGPMIYCGFRPSLIVVKNTTSATGWEMYDDERIGFNEQNNVLRANDSAAELSYSGRAIDLVSNGFKVRSSDTPINASGNTYIYMAFAENPFKYANAR